MVGGPDLAVKMRRSLWRMRRWQEAGVSGIASSEKCKKVTNAEKNDEQGFASN